MPSRDRRDDAIDPQVVASPVTLAAEAAVADAKATTVFLIYPCPSSWTSNWNRLYCLLVYVAGTTVSLIYPCGQATGTAYC